MRLPYGHPDTSDDERRSQGGKIHLRGLSLVHSYLCKAVVLVGTAAATSALSDLVSG